MVELTAREINHNFMFPLYSGFHPMYSFHIRRVSSCHGCPIMHTENVFLLIACKETIYKQFCCMQPLNRHVCGFPERDFFPE